MMRGVRAGNQIQKVAFRNCYGLLRFRLQGFICEKAFVASFRDNHIGFGLDPGSFSTLAAVS